MFIKDENIAIFLKAIFYRDWRLRRNVGADALEKVLKPLAPVELTDDEYHTLWIAGFMGQVCDYAFILIEILLYRTFIKDRPIAWSLGPYFIIPTLLYGIIWIHIILTLMFPPQPGLVFYYQRYKRFMLVHGVTDTES